MAQPPKSESINHADYTAGRKRRQLWQGQDWSGSRPEFNPFFIEVFWVQDRQAAAYKGEDSTCHLEAPS